jgi:hypothetical protein
MAQNTFNDGDSLGVVRGVLNANAIDAETRLASLQLRGASLD